MVGLQVNDLVVVIVSVSFNGEEKTLSCRFAMKKRLVKGMKHCKWTTKDWKKLLWTDEVEIFDSSHMIFVHHRVGSRR